LKIPPAWLDGNSRPVLRQARFAHVQLPQLPRPGADAQLFSGRPWAGKHGRHSTKFAEIRYSSYFVISGDRPN